MGGVLDWSTTPGSNTTVDGVNIAEGMQPGLVNNGMRAIMALVREWQLDAAGVVTAGSGDAYTIASNQGIAAYSDGLRFSFRADRNNTGAATLNVDGRGAKALRKVTAGALAALVADDIVAEAVYDVVFDVSSDVFVIVGFSGLQASAFMQTVLDDADAATARATLGVTIGTNVQAYDADLTAVAALSGTGILVHTGAGTWAERTITSSGGTVTITNPGGVAGNINLEAANAWTLVSSSSTWTGGTQTVTGLGGYSQIMVVADQLTATLSGRRWLRVGSGSILSTSIYVRAVDGVQGEFACSTSSTAARSFAVIIDRFNTTDAVKPAIFSGDSSSNTPVLVSSASQMDRIQVLAESGSIDGGTLYVWGKV